MALTNESLGLTEQANIDRQPAAAGPRRDDFPTGTFVRTRSPMIDDMPIDIGNEPRPLDVGYVREDWVPDEFVPVNWSQAGCGCSTAKENPAELVKITEVEYNLFVSGFNAGYNSGFDNARPTAS